MRLNVLKASSSLGRLYQVFPIQTWAILCSVIFVFITKVTNEINSRLKFHLLSPLWSTIRSKVGKMIVSWLRDVLTLIL